MCNKLLCYQSNNTDCIAENLLEIYIMSLYTPVLIVKDDFNGNEGLEKVLSSCYFKLSLIDAYA